MECTASKICLPLLFTVMYISWNIESNVFISDYYLLLLPITAWWWGLKSVTLVSLSCWSSGHFQLSLVPREHQRHSVLLKTLCFASLSWELHQIAIVYNGFLQIEDIVCESECERESLLSQFSTSRQRVEGGLQNYSWYIARVFSPL